METNREEKLEKIIINIKDIVMKIDIEYRTKSEQEILNTIYKFFKNDINIFPS